MQALLLRDTRTACTMHSIKHNRLEAAVLFAIQYQVGTAVSYSEMIAHINTAPLKKSQSHRLNDQIGGEQFVIEILFPEQKKSLHPVRF